MRNIVVDSGSLIALFDGSDRFHAQAVAFLKELNGRLVCNLPVITEVVFMLDFSPQAQRDFLHWAQKALFIDQETVSDLFRINDLMKQYADLPADFADASLVALCERLDTRFVASVDRDFTVYRDRAKRYFTNLLSNREVPADGFPTGTIETVEGDAVIG